MPTIFHSPTESIGSKSSKVETIGLGVGLGVGLVLVVLMSVISWQIWKRNRVPGSSDNQFEKAELPASNTVQPQELDDTDLQELPEDQGTHELENSDPGPHELPSHFESSARET
ncbi:hypothetical protein JX265_005914 [Neoarthrinium moseri]|uniref:Uncharacterized protein n=1 Tax=Neoarthrinium moseri TaxID=1658444 RepID=A0A9P9WP20_9PEZI|nr:hypothetical protein JX266_008043 [Neoarthrinium moseri]KAI1871928.1 hypothetical protein JX265_005914 [Neoarthrinium moseri]